MNKKLLLGIALFGFIWTLLILGGSYYIYKNNLEPRLQSNKIKIEQQGTNKPNEKQELITISRNKLDEYNLAFLQKELIKTERDSIMNLSNRLNDSLNKLKNNFSVLNDSVKNQLNTNKKFTENNSNPLLDTINHLKSRLEQTQSDLSLAKKLSNDMEHFMSKKFDSLEVQNFQSFAKIYDNTSPTEVAKILERIDGQNAAMILKYMQKKKAGKVLEAMNPSRAAAIMLLGAGN